MRIIRRLSRGLFRRKTRSDADATPLADPGTGSKAPPRTHDSTPVAAQEPAKKAPPRTHSERPERLRSASAPVTDDRADAAPVRKEPWPPPPVEGKVRFQDLGLSQPLLHAIADLNFRYCTPVQARTLPHALRGLNVAGRAQTGTGKTAAFMVAILERIAREPTPADRPNGTPRALILAPTRELVVQVIHDADDLSRHMETRAVAVYGGMDVERQRRQLQRTVDIVAATPGRLLDFINRGAIDLRRVETLVIDEADRMLDMGFIPDVRRIVGRMPGRDARQTLLFSATLTPEVLRLASQWMTEPAVVEVDPEQVAVNTVRPILYSVTADDKFTLLVNLLRRPEMSRVLVFGNRRDTTQRLTDRLRSYGIRCELLSGDVEQRKRLRILDDFRSGATPVVVATDVAARGLHVEDVSHVVNYDFPYEPEDYVHRIGRTGRVGRSGIAISFACEDESFVIPEIEKYLGDELPCIQPEDDLLKPIGPPTVREAPSDAHRPAQAGSRGRDRDRGRTPRRHVGSRPRRR